MSANGQHHLAGRVALVTGGSRGIGRAVALRLVAAGARVAITYRDGRREAEAVARESRALGEPALVLAADLARPGAAADLVESTARELGPVDILVHNAGGSPRLPLAELTLDDWDEAFAVNARAGFQLAQAVAPHMRERGWGRIVYLSSLAAYTGGVTGAHYAASKAALLGLTHYLSNHLGGDGITVNARAPAGVATRLTTPDDRERHAGVAAVRRGGTPEEVADLVDALVRNGFLTGQTIRIDGGVRLD